MFSPKSNKFHPAGLFVRNENARRKLFEITGHVDYRTAKINSNSVLTNEIQHLKLEETKITHAIKEHMLEKECVKFPK